MSKTETIKRILEKLEVVQKNSKTDLSYLEGRIDQILDNKKNK